MSDTINAKNESGSAKYAPHKNGQFVAQCVDVIDLGEKVDSGPNYPDKLSPKCVLVFRTGEKNEKGEPHDVAQEYTVSMYEKANLRKALETWRGQPYTEGQVNDGVPLHKLMGQWALITVAHKQSKKDRTYAFIQSIIGVPAMLKERPVFDSYKRAEFWQERKDEYAQDAAKFRALHAAPAGAIDDEGFPPASDDDDSSLPF